MTGYHGLKIWQPAVAIVVGAGVFLMVLTGTVQATGAAPGGVLTGRWAFLASIVSHALTGALTTWVLFFEVGGCLAIVFALVGAFRRRRRWFTPLLWLAAVVAAAVGSSAVTSVLDWLGSASPGVWDGAHTWSPPYWDAAAFWSANAMVGTILLVTSPDSVRGLWRWSNGGSFGDGAVWFLVPAVSAAAAVACVPLVVMWAAIFGTWAVLFG